jgi:Tfp pilus assembly protein PilN
MPDIKINIGSSPVTARAASGPTLTASVKSATVPAPAIKIPAPAKTAGPGTLNIFSQTAAKAEAPKMLQSIVAGKSDAISRLKPILGNAVAMQKTLEEEKSLRQRKKLHMVQIIFVFVFILSALSFGYFYSELAPGFDFFGQNTTAKLTNDNTNLRDLQTKINKFRYFAAQQELSQFSLLADQFLDGTSRLSDPNTTASQRSIILASMNELTTSMPTVLSRIQDDLNQDITVSTLRSEAEPELTADEIRMNAENDLRAEMTKYKDQLAGANDPNNFEELTLTNNAIQLVGNQPLLTAIKNVSVDNFKKDLTDYVDKLDAVKRGELQTLFSSILSTTRSDIATISTIKSKRINWSSVIDHIETVTMQTDSSFGNKIAYARDGGIVYSGYEFDAQANRIVLSGITSKKIDATNFTLISNLIDNLEASPYFKDVEMRSFSKSGDAASGYIANFKIDLSLQTDVASVENKPISLTREALYERMGRKRLRPVTVTDAAGQTI